MTAQAGAILNTSSAWDAVDWRTIEDNVRRLQARIVKAVQQKKWNKVKALQHLLTHSASGKLLAVRRVTVNDGRKTPGVDGELWDTPHKKLQGVISLTARGYRPMPLRRIYIPKANGKLRPLGIPTMRDRAMQALYLLSLDPVAETTADQNSYGFRQGRSCADAIEQCFTSLCHKNPSWVLEGDIKGCFDNISHQWLLDNVPLNKAILPQVAKVGLPRKTSILRYDRWHTAGRNHIARAVKHHSRRPRTPAPGSFPGTRKRLRAWSSSASTFDPLCGRLHHHRTLRGVAENDGEAAGRILPG
jgi:RNA-directed DNA polymerase